MFIILKEDIVQNNTTVVNIIYGESCDTYIENYLCYLLSLFEEMQSEKVYYNIDKEKLSIVKTEIVKENGYFYSSKKEVNTPVYILKSLEYNPKSLDIYNTYTNKENNKLWENINTEINHRVLKNMDRDSLYKIFIDLDNNMKIKTNWTSNDYINILNELLKNFRKELYSSIAKKLKRYNNNKSK